MPPVTDLEIRDVIHAAFLSMGMRPARIMAQTDEGEMRQGVAVTTRDGRQWMITIQEFPVCKH